MGWLSTRSGALALGLFCLSLPWSARALDPAKAITQYVHSTWRVEDGLPQNGITMILQTRDGYLWVGTQEGLARFDGVNFTTFDHVNTPSLHRDYISDLVEDSQGTLWIATTNGGVVAFRDGLFSHLNAIEPRGGSVLAAGPDGSLWIGGYGGLKQFKNGLLVKAYTVSSGLSGDPVKALAVDKTGAVWIGSPGGLNRLADGKMQTYSVQDGLPDNDVTTLRLVADGTLLVKTKNSEFVRWDHGSFVPWHIPGVAGSNIRDVIVDGDGNYWLASGTEGLLRLSGSQLSRFTTADGLASNAMYHVYEDRDGNLWASSVGDGLERFRDGSFTTFAKAEGLSDEQTYSVLEDSNGDIWTTSSDALYQQRKNKIRAYKTVDRTTASWSLWIDHASNLLVGTSKGLLQMIHGSLAPLPTGCAHIPAYWTSGLVEDSAHQLWVATRGGGLVRCVDGKITNLYTIKDGLLSNTLYAVAQGLDGTMWIGSDNGLNSIQDGHIKSYPRFSGASSVWIISLYLDSKNVLWIGTFGQGLFRMEGDRFTQYTARQGLQNDTVYSIVEDTATNLWVGSDNGISRITREDLDAVAASSHRTITPLVFGKTDGMKNSDASGGSQPNAWRAHDGRLWFPTGRGVVVVDPARLKLNNSAPSSHIEQMTADEAQIDLATPVVLASGTRRLEIRYTAPNLSSPERTQFRYRLEGFDEQWVPGGIQRVAHYTNLPPGHYTFHVNAKVATGPWSTQEGVLAFDLRPQFYQTLWFQLLCGLASISLLWGAYRLRVSLLHARASVLEERQRIAREIHDSLAQGLSGILFQTEVALMSVTLAPDMTLTHIVAARDLAKTSLDDARYSVWNLSPPVLDQKILSESLSSMAHQLASGRVKELDIESTGLAWPIPPDAKHHIVMIAQEAISNAIQHGKALKIRVTLTFGTDFLSLEIADDGVGFPVHPTKQDLIRGYGLRNMQHRAEHLGAKLSVVSEVGKGTSVSIHAPRLGHFGKFWRRLRGSAISRIDG
jgi:signal transduction histidine kinase/ligand-binding sensor domain-containing protein